jgi:hypothetical protein
VNDIFYEVKWTKSLETLDLVGTKYRLKMKLFKCDVYSYTFLDCPDPIIPSEDEEKKTFYRI